MAEVLTQLKELLGISVLMQTMCISCCPREQSGRVRQAQRYPVKRAGDFYRRSPRSRWELDVQSGDPAVEVWIQSGCSMELTQLISAPYCVVIDRLERNVFPELSQGALVGEPIVAQDAELGRLSEALIKRTCTFLRGFEFARVTQTNKVSLPPMDVRLGFDRRPTLTLGVTIGGRR